MSKGAWLEKVWPLILYGETRSSIPAVQPESGLRLDSVFSGCLKKEMAIR